MKRSLSSPGFTLLELLTVVAIIIVLAGLILGGMGYAQQKAASSRAEAEIAAFSAALESYKVDNGDYPRVLLQANGTPASPAVTSDDANPITTPIPTKPRSLILYQALSGDLPLTMAATSTARQYMEFKKDMLETASAGSPAVTSVTALLDPFGNPYGYSTNPAPAARNNPTFDLWSTAGVSTGSPTTADRLRFIKNW